MKQKLSDWMECGYNYMDRKTALKRLQAGIYPGFTPVREGRMWYVMRVGNASERLDKIERRASCQERGSRVT